MSEPIRVPLNGRQLTGLSASFAEIQFARRAYGVALKATLEAADIDASTVADAVIDGGDLVVTFNPTAAPTAAPTPPE